ncbi:hypothetical protein LGH83_16800 [Lichenihabitans sp. PAMC28606]|uniref:hypothetical protein n=1 Tax=Lichenihabitans sp. PAMC28606 TaxID=2880932 RepID=UPI001D0A6EF9|nr:hypothetical protein [Lichenihabitans sp. PAMC28606]UDL94169.1 hypothetical protein LGH83_16800 [Lichenihabitans sp. PAMC28606]
MTANDLDRGHAVAPVSASPVGFQSELDLDHSPATDLSAAWDDRVRRSLTLLPDRVRRGVEWLRVPSRRWLRLVAGCLLILGGCLSILPVLGLWMLPLGFALLGEDFPPLKPRLERVALWCERQWSRVRSR